MNTQCTGLIVHITSQPGCREEMATLVKGLFDEHQQQSEFAYGAVHLCSEEPDSLIAYELWHESREKFEKRLIDLRQVRGLTPEGRRAEALVATRRMTWLDMPALWLSAT